LKKVKDGAQLYYSSCAGELNITVGVGPCRSGKTLFKSVIESHLLKHGGMYQAIDIDSGREFKSRKAK
jgi:phosphate starvation-inducible protein PhoH